MKDRKSPLRSGSLFASTEQKNWNSSCFQNFYLAQTVPRTCFLEIKNVETSFPEIEHSPLQWEVAQQTIRLRSQYLWLVCYFGVVELRVMI